VSQPPTIASDAKPNERHKPGIMARVINLGITIILALFMAWLLQTFIFQFYQVQQDSMETTLQPGQYILVDKLSGNFVPYTRGDIVIFRAPEALGVNTPFVKRVIGLPGDTVDLKDGRVFINGQALSEPYVFTDDGSGSQPESNHPSHWVVPAGQVFLMGDHRNVSRDSRDFGPVNISSIIGRAYIRAWPSPVFFNTAPWDNH
jgi:signal peptidase I